MNGDQLADQLAMHAALIAPNVGCRFGHVSPDPCLACLVAWHHSERIDT